MKTYTTIQDDMWDSVAYKALGSCSHTHKLMLANQKHIHTFIFPAGITLEIPEIKVSANDRLPPWKEKKG